MSKTGIYVQQQAKKNAANWIENYARIGIAAKGVVYILIGVLAAMAVFSTSGGNNGKNGAFRTLLEQPFGQVLLGLVIIGLLGYVGWRMIQAFMDPERNGGDTEGITKRTGFFISGLVYLFIAFSGLRLLLPSLSNGSSSSGGRQLLVAKMLQQPYGQWFIGIAAAIIIGKGIYQLYKAYTGKFKNKIKKHEMSKEEKSTFMRAGRLGYTARGIVLGIIGYFLLQAALQSDASEAQGTEGALNFLGTTGGPYLMAAVAIGLACYGVFMFVKAKYRYMPRVAQ